MAASCLTVISSSRRISHALRNGVTNGRCEETPTSMSAGGLGMTPLSLSAAGTDFGWVTPILPVAPRCAGRGSNRSGSEQAGDLGLPHRARVAQTHRHGE